MSTPADHAEEPVEVAQDDAERKLAEHGLISAAGIAVHFGLSGDSSARRLMAEHGVTQVHGYPKDEALGVPRPGRQPGPGRGHRAPRQKPPADS
ncbi:hypothetical protein [Saccharothrix sp. HUAS TT1]|uniref:hypothetical protein n=1 Tax=unclassified Saccharothrix TaxID=2593673 RepID=UPI00345C2434